MDREIVNLIERAPQDPGVYVFKDSKNIVLYVGKAVNLRERLKSYAYGRDERPTVSIFTPKIAFLEWIITRTEKEALLLENTTIKTLRPKYNIDLRDDKSFVRLKLTAHDFPGLYITRKVDTKGAEYFGPYASAGQLRQTLKLIQKIFKVRDCTDDFYKSRTRPCLRYQINRCSAPCVGKVTQADYQTQVTQTRFFLRGKKDELMAELKAQMQSYSQTLDFEKAAVMRNRIRAIEATLEPQHIEAAHMKDADVFGIAGDAQASVIKKLQFRQGRLVHAFEWFVNEPLSIQDELVFNVLREHYLNEHISDLPKTIVLPCAIPAQDEFEEVLCDQKQEKVKVMVPQKGVWMDLLQLANQNAQSTLLERKRKSEANEKLLTHLQEKFHLKNYPRRIEGYDISSFHGSFPIGAQVSFFEGEPDKTQYRQYKIQTIKGSNDFGMMNEMFERRMKKIVMGETDPPDLILVDGGKGQLAQALSVMQKYNLTQIDVLSLAKEKDQLSSQGSKRAPERVFLPNQKNAIVLKPNDPVLHLLMRVRDEAHRFGVKHHRKGRSKAFKMSPLKRIKGVGDKTFKALLKHFGSLEGVRNSTLEDLKSVSGVSETIAQLIFKAMQDPNFFS